MTASLLLPQSVQSVPETLAFWAEASPQAPALITAGRRVVTYGELWQAVQAIAALRSEGLSVKSLQEYHAESVKA